MECEDGCSPEAIQLSSDPTISPREGDFRTKTIFSAGVVYCQTATLVLGLGLL